MSKHSVIVAADGSIRVDHNTEALQGLAVLGGSAALNQQEGEAPAHPVDPEEVAIIREVNARLNDHHTSAMSHRQRLNTATHIAAAILHRGQTRRRDADYIADKSAEIANALHDRFPAADSNVTWDSINAAVRAERSAR